LFKFAIRHALSISVSFNSIIHFFLGQKEKERMKERERKKNIGEKKI
jgi:hypothetical protein